MIFCIRKELFQLNLSFNPAEDRQTDLKSTMESSFHMGGFYVMYITYIVVSTTISITPTFLWINSKSQCGDQINFRVRYQTLNLSLYKLSLYIFIQYVGYILKESRRNSPFFTSLKELTVRLANILLILFIYTQTLACLDMLVKTG